jgi:hypothetical protein
LLGVDWVGPTCWWVVVESPITGGLVLLGFDGSWGEVEATGSVWVMGPVLTGGNDALTDTPKAPCGPTSSPPGVATIVTVCKQEPGNPINGWSLVEVTVAVHGPFPIGESDGVLAGAVASKLVLSFCGDVGAVGGLVVLPCGDTGAAGGLGLLFGGDTGTAGGLVLLVSGSIGAAGELTLIGVAFKLVV